MHAIRSFLVAALFVAFCGGASSRAQGANVALSGQGATLTFSESDAGWRWTAIATPAAPETRTVEELGYQITTSVGTDNSPSAAGWGLIENSPERVVLEHDFMAVGVRLRRVFSFGPADNVARMETWARSLGDTTELAHASLLNARFAGESFHDTGLAPQSFPLFGQNMFVGIEHVSGECHSWGEIAFAAQTPHLPLTTAWTKVAAVIIGWSQPGADLIAGQSAIRAAFIHYLDTVRIKPADFELHSNTWWTLPLPFSEQDVLKDIEALRRGLYDRTGMFFDSYALDLGWSDPHSVWRIDAQRFPNGFTKINEQLAALGCKLGLWMSPGSGYPEGLDNGWLQQQGYETTPFNGPNGVAACFALGGRYQQAAKESMIGYAREYGLGHVKLDLMDHVCNVPGHGHAVGDADSFYAIDAGLADVLDGLRAVNPDMALEPLCCGSPPSPWWTMHTPFLLGPNGDDVPYGRVPSPEWMESLITARDVAYRSAQAQWIMPTQALETFDIVMQCPGNFANMAVMAVGRGRWFLSTYLKPDYMQPEDWDFLAGLVRWARANKQYLGDAQMIGGAPDKKEAYGYMFHNADKDIYCIRNPWMEQRTIQLPVAANVTVVRDLRALYPRRAMMARLQPGAAGPKITLAPYETMLLETVPYSSSNKTRSLPSYKATIAAAAPQAALAPGASMRYVWEGTITVPNVPDPQLCVLVQGATGVKDATCSVTWSDAPLVLTPSRSSGQFAAAWRAQSEHWSWYSAPVEAGTHTFRIEANVPLKTASVGVYLRGTMPVACDPAPTKEVAFPLLRPTQRSWSQTLTSLKSFTVK